jgi:hypothetical protein
LRLIAMAPTIMILILVVIYELENHNMRWANGLLRLTSSRFNRGNNNHWCSHLIQQSTALGSQLPVL